MKKIFSRPGWMALGLSFGLNAQADYPSPQGILQSVYQNTLELLIPSCLESTECDLKPDEREVLEQELRDLKQNLALSKIQFVHGSERPDLFRSPETPAHRLSVTGDHIGTPIYFDIDALAHLAGSAAGFDVSQAVGILVHELGHHLGLHDTETRLLDRVGSRLRLFTASNQAHLESEELSGTPAGFALEIVQPGKLGPSISDSTPSRLPVFLMSTPTDAFLFGDAETQQLFGCSSIYIRGRPLRTSLSNLRWVAVIPLDSKTVEWHAEADEQVTCYTADHKWVVGLGDFHARIRLSLKADGSIDGAVKPWIIHWVVPLPDPTLSSGFEISQAQAKLIQRTSPDSQDWTLSGKISFPSADIAAGSCQVFYTLDPMEFPRYATFANEWDLQSCTLTRAPNSTSAEFEAFVRLAPERLAKRMQITRLRLKWAPDRTVDLAFPRRIEISAPRTPEDAPTATSELSTRHCQSTETDCYAVMGLAIPSGKNLLHVQIDTSFFTSNPDDAYLTRFPALNATVDIEGRMTDAAAWIETASNGTRRIFWRIPKSQLAQIPDFLVLGAYRLIFSDFSTLTSGQGTRMEVIRP